MFDATLTINDGVISDNSASVDGGGIYTEDYDYNDPADDTKYMNISIASIATVSGNTASVSYTEPGNYLDFTNRTTNPFDGTLLTNNEINYIRPTSLTYTLTYDANDINATGTTVDNRAYNSGDTAVIIDNGFTLTGYDFIGWNTESNGSGNWYYKDNTLTITGDTTLYAQWDAKAAYTLTYDANDVNATGTTEDNTVYYSGDTAVVKDNGFTLTGYDFIGWNTESNGSGTWYYKDNTLTIAGDTILYAQWDAKAAYTLTYDANDANATGITEDNTVYYSGDTAVVKDNAFTLTGYDFIGWNAEADGNGVWYYPGGNITITNDTILYAQWKTKSDDTYTVTYDANSNDATGSTADGNGYKSGDKAVVKENGYELTGYDFIGWNTAADGSGSWHYSDDEITIINDITLYAQWDAKAAYTLTYDANDANATGITEDNTVYYLGDTAVVKDNGFTLTGYDFIGWNAEADGSGVWYYPGGNITITNDTILYAQWKTKSDDTYTVTYDANSNDATGSTADGNGYKSGDKAVVKENGYELIGFDFIGWNTAANGSGSWHYPDDEITIINDTILYAQWKLIEEEDIDVNKSVTNLTAENESRTNNKVGDVLKYTVTVNLTNTGDTLNNVTFNDAIPSGVTLNESTIEVDGASADYTYTDGMLTIQLADSVTGDKTFIITYEAAINESAAGTTVSNNVVVTATTPEEEEKKGEDKEDVDVDEDINVTKTVTNLTAKSEGRTNNKIGDVLKYTVTVNISNTGDELNDVIFEDAMPEGVTLDESTIEVDGSSSDYTFTDADNPAC